MSTRTCVYPSYDRQRDTERVSGVIAAARWLDWQPSVVVVKHEVGESSSDIEPMLRVTGHVGR